MGHILEIHCSNCGLDEAIGEDGSDSLYIGNGMMDYEILAKEHPEKLKNGMADLTREPHYCSSCEIIFANELGDDPVSCPKCKSSEHVHSYRSEEACETEPPLTEYGDPDLTQGSYFCPRCNTFSLKFLETGFWD